MNQRMTKDELFLLTLYKIAHAKGDPTHQIDRFLIGKAINQNERMCNNIVRHLAQANFIKKGDENFIYLTEQGLRLVDQLRR